MFELNNEVVQKLKNDIDTGVESYSKFLSFYTTTPAGKDANIEIFVDSEDTMDSIADKIFDYYDGFDVSTETYLWLDNEGHGKNGAPYEMRDVLEDTEWEESWIYDVYAIFRDWKDSH